VPTYKRSDSGGRKYDKKLACFFCEKILMQKMKRHLESVHKEEPEIESILSKPKAQQELLFASVVCRGNFNYNVKVLEQGVGELIVGRRPTTVTKPDDYLPCIHCLAFYLSRDLYAHTASCKFRSHEADEPAAKENEKDNKDILAKARMLLSGALHQDYASVSDKFRTEILDKMRYDNVSKYVRTDSLILKYGSTLHRRHGSNRCHDISQKMRLLARLVLATREGAENRVHSSSTLESLISGRGFDAVIEATESLCQLEDDELGRPLFKNPSLALHVGHVLVKCAEIKKGMGIRNNFPTTIADADAFLALHKADWTSRISSAALATFKYRRYNNPDVLPLTDDLLKLKTYQEKMLSILTTSLAETPEYTTWRQLLEIVYSRVVIFNKRRCGETAKLLLSAFENRPSWQQSANDQIVGTLKPLEQELLKR
jgi:sulfur relay (sulfurtransferase) DsrF/TusC family protein